MRKRKNTSSQGFTIAEALMAMVILGLVFSPIVLLLSSLGRSDKKSRTLQSMVVSRNQILAELKDPNNFGAIIASNATFACLQNGTDCGGGALSGSFDLYDQALFDEFAFKTNPSLGFDLDGNTCTAYVAPPTAGNRSCPFGLAVNATALCPAVGDINYTNCLNPTVQIVGTYTLNSDNPDQNNIIMSANRVSELGFTVLQNGMSCPAQVSPAVISVNPPANKINLTNAAGVYTIASTDSHANNVNGAVGEALSQSITPACRNVTVTWSEDMVTAANPPVVPYTVSDANNTSSVCIADAGTGQCLYSFIRTYPVAGNPNNAAQIGNIYELQEVNPTNPPHYDWTSTQTPWLGIIDPNPNPYMYQFNVNNGVVSFCIANSGFSGGAYTCTDYFDQILTKPFVFKFHPAGTVYSAGYSGVTVTIQ